MADLLEDENNTLVFCGYSGLDYFDVLPFFNQWSRFNQVVAAKAIWLHHQDDPTSCFAWGNDQWDSVLSFGAIQLLQAFAADNKTGFMGNTQNQLAKLIPFTLNDEPSKVAVWPRTIVTHEQLA